jgi:EmrB/QacA subfamily drug resistance transporter
MQRNEGSVAYRTATGRWVILATVLGSGIAFLDSTVVNVALPSIKAEFETGFSSLQWTVDAYLLTLGAFLLVGGSLGDLFGRRRIFILGLGGFTFASLLCGIAPSISFLIAARALQGLGAAMLVPGSLAIISASFKESDRGQAIGAWSGLSGVTTAVGPFLGGWLVDSVSWRWVFLINLPLAALAIVIALKHVPETRDETAARTPDVAGGATAALALGGIVFALIEGPVRGWGGTVTAAIVVGCLSLAAFVIVEMRVQHPMLPFGIFRNRQFTAANATTLTVYAALSGALFLVTQQLLSKPMGYSAVEAGLSFMPLTITLLLLSPTAGKLASRHGPRFPMTFGPIGVGIGLLLIRTGVVPGSHYLTDILPGILVFSLGLGFTVAPLTTAVMGAVEERHAGIGSGVNNAVARIAALLAVALLPFVAGIAGHEGTGGPQFTHGIQKALLVAAFLCFAGGITSLIGIRDPNEGSASVPPAADHPAETTSS